MKMIIGTLLMTLSFSLLSTEPAQDERPVETGEVLEQEIEAEQIQERKPSKRLGIVDAPRSRFARENEGQQRQRPSRRIRLRAAIQ